MALPDRLDRAIAPTTKAGKFGIPLSTGRRLVIEAPLDLTADEFKEFIGEVALNFPRAVAEAYAMSSKPKLVIASAMPQRPS